MKDLVDQFSINEHQTPLVERASRDRHKDMAACDPASFKFYNRRVCAIDKATVKHKEQSIILSNTEEE